jgi:hypothetical protein
VLDHTYTIVQPAFGLSLVLTGTPGDTVTPPTVTVSGQPNPGEYLTLICDRQFVPPDIPR